ncbi:TPA: nucleotidyltransferase domain-containing protein [Candidatus Woesearchaeota archaeon]|jgi:predicted nucleotidyltransferase|nr:nucleotidyltransferase [archaeon]HIJ11079.1 nucleotidyltransferase domain-containing protein [Candidatus Woesearchaeota archaeon]|tara:strand:- start:1092 stop:1481 length:390 start_codon:yes stop_codon:yes gene_type:complete
MDLPQILSTIQKLDKKKKIKFIVLFGSCVTGNTHPLSDIDMAIYYDAKRNDCFDFQLHVLGSLPENVDVKIFQHLPTLLQNEVIQGTILYSKDSAFTTEQFIKVIKSYQSFSRPFNLYLDTAKGDVVGT